MNMLETKCHLLILEDKILLPQLTDYIAKDAQVESLFQPFEYINHISINHPRLFIQSVQLNTQ